MLLRRVPFGICIAACIVLLHSKAFAQSASNQTVPLSISASQPINPITGPSFPCPQPSDPLAQLVCSTPQLALLDMQFVQSYKALYQQVGVENDPALRHEDFEFDLAVRSQCNIAVSQGATQSSTPPPAAPAGAAQCVFPLYQQQIAIWKARLQGAAAEEADRSIPQQVALQGRLQALGFLPAQAQLDGVFGTGTRAAIIQWQTSTGRQPTGLLGDADAQILLADAPQSTPNSSPNPPVQTQAQSPSPPTPTQPNSSVETAWAPYTQYAACMLSKGFQLQTFVQDGVLPTDAIAASVLNSCIQTAQQATSAPTSPQAVVPDNSNNDASDADPTESSNEPLNGSSGSTSTVAPNWTLFAAASGCALKSVDNNVNLLYVDNAIKIGIQAGNIPSDNITSSTPMTIQFSDGQSFTTDIEPEVDPTGGTVASGFPSNAAIAIVNEFKSAKDTDSVVVTIGSATQTESMAGASENLPSFAKCVQANINSANNSAAQNPAPAQDNSNTQPQSSQTYTVTIQCVRPDNASDGGYNNAGYTCMEPGNGDTDLSDGGSVLINDATGNHNYGALDFIKAVNDSGNNGGNIQLTLTPPFEVKAQAGGIGEPFQLDVQIQNSSGKVVYDNKTVQAFGVIDVTDADLSN